MGKLSYIVNPKYVRTFEIIDDMSIIPNGVLVEVKHWDTLFARTLHSTSFEIFSSREEAEAAILIEKLIS